MKTAVEWLVEQLKVNNYLSENAHWLFDDAIKMEKQQTINTWYDCKLSIIDKNPTDADQYYNKTYKK